MDKGKLPFRDYNILGEEKVSNLNNTEITVGYRKMGTKYNENKEPTSFYDIYFADFIYQDIGYRVTAERVVTQEEFVKVLQSIIK